MRTVVRAFPARGAALLGAGVAVLCVTLAASLAASPVAPLTAPVASPLTSSLASPLASSLASPPPPSPGALPDGEPNVLLIVLDDIGVEWFESYGIGQLYTSDPGFRYCRTPVIDSLRAQGVLFREAYASPVCGPTRANLHTGRYGMRTGFGENLRDPETLITGGSAPGNRLSDDLPWLPRAIHTARPGVFDTAVVGKWHLCDAYSSAVSHEVGTPVPPPDINLDHAVAVGYDFSAIHMPNYGGAYNWYRVKNGVLDPAAGFAGPPFDETTWIASVHVDDALGWIHDPGRTGPWFLNLSFNPPHAAFTVPPFSTLSAMTQAELVAADLEAGDSRSTAAPYAEVELIWRASMESVDHCIGRLLDGLDAATRANTMIVVVGDNGTVANARPPGFLHGKREVYRGGTQVPLIVAGPSVVDPGRESSALVHCVDIYATVLDLLSASEPPDARDYDGVSFLPVLRNEPGLRKYVYAESFSPWGVTDPVLQASGAQRAIFDGRWRYVVSPSGPQLYDDAESFLEAATDDVIADHPDEAERLRRKLDELLGS